MARKMALKEWFIDRYRFRSDTLVVAFKGNNPVDHQKRITMRQDLHNILRIHNPCPLRNHLRRNHRYHVRVPFSQSLRQFSVGRMSRLDRNDVPQKSATGQKELTDDIEN